jgi:hypothetical protein
MRNFQSLSHIIAQRHAYRGNFETVGEAVMHEHTARKREYLGLVLQTTERCREDESVVITLKLGPVVMSLSMLMLLSKTFI